MTSIFTRSRDKLQRQLVLVFAFLFVLSSQLLYGQTPGLIVDPATFNAVTGIDGRDIMDPNRDGYISSTPSGWVRYVPPASAVDQTNSEIPFLPIPVPAAEPTSDLGPGPDCGFSDFVDSGTEDPALYYLDAAGNLIFRFRLGRLAPNSKGYSVLIDTEIS